MAITAASYSAGGFLGSGPGLLSVPGRSGLGSEYVEITGAGGAIGDTTTYLVTNGEIPLQIEGGAFVVTSVSGGTATIKALVTLGGEVVVVKLLTRPRLS